MSSSLPKPFTTSSVCASTSPWSCNWLALSTRGRRLPAGRISISNASTPCREETARSVERTAAADQGEFPWMQTSVRSGVSFKRRAPHDSSSCRDSMETGGVAVPPIVNSTVGVFRSRGVNVKFSRLQSSSESSSSPSSPAKLRRRMPSLEELPGLLASAFCAVSRSRFDHLRTHGRNQGLAEKREVELQCARLSSKPWMCAIETWATRRLFCRKR
mmetsp:Transcript_78579/g.202382  ORF Transcript_78579/g.202382 Transcript_78579/m.202382 type:complete len:216 (-) Transcript_78579:1149-1796(-)